MPIKRRGSNFYRFFCYAIAICLLIGVAFALTIKTVTESDQDEYQELMRKFAGEDKNVIPETSYTLNQRRQGVRKDIVFVEDGDRKKLSLTSAKAEVIVDKIDKHILVNEKLMDVCCWMQEELYYRLPDGREAKRQPNGLLLIHKGHPEDPQAWIDERVTTVEPWQRLRYMEADVAYYSYASEILEAERVNISRYDLPGHDLLEHFDGFTPLLTGLAESVSFSLGGKELNFKATKFKAVVNTMENK